MTLKPPAISSHHHRENREWNEGAARAQLLKIFEAAGPMSDVVKNGRRKLSAILFRMSASGYRKPADLPRRRSAAVSLVCAILTPRGARAQRVRARATFNMVDDAPWRRSPHRHDPARDRR
ncbi:MAG: tetratricopeptide repeat protein [Caulobacteraceae bacterium]|nr:tetratricopeptide repeat protein [Caulobacteraceae bacterium]